MMPLQTVSDVTCIACGCVCDDLAVHVAGDTIQHIDRACRTGDAWFRQQAARMPPGDQSAAIRQAAELLVNAKAPHFVGLEYLDCEAQQVALKLAREVGATIAGDETVTTMFPAVGDVTCQYGDARDRADALIYWNVDLSSDHWRHAERIMHPAIARGARVLHLRGDFQQLWKFASHLQRGETPGDRLAETLSQAKYAVIVHRATGEMLVALRLVATLANRDRRCRLLDLGAGRNAAGLRQVTGWNPPPPSLGDGLAQSITLCFGKVIETSQIALITEINTTPAAPQIALFAGTPGLHALGTVFRPDGVSLPLRPAFPTSFPSAVTVLKELLGAVMDRRTM